MNEKRTHTIALIAIFTALTTSMTMLLKVPVPFYGYINLGDIAVLLGAVILPVRGAVFAAGIGSMLADILGGYPQYAIFTLFIKALEALIVVLTIKRFKGKLYFIPFYIAGIAMALAYALVDGVLFKDVNAFVVSFVSINLPQALIASTLSALFYPKFMTLVKRLRSIDS